MQNKTFFLPKLTQQKKKAENKDFKSVVFCLGDSFRINTAIHGYAAYLRQYPAPYESSKQNLSFIPITFQSLLYYYKYYK